MRQVNKTSEMQLILLGFVVTNCCDNLLSKLLPPANEVWGKVMFLHLCVILFTGGSASEGVCIQGGLHPGGSASRGSASEGEGVGQIPPQIGYYGTRSTSGWYASYWNAFLCLVVADI